MSKKHTKIGGWLEKESKKTAKEVHGRLSHEEVVMLTAMTFIVAFMQVASMLMNMHQWATTNPDFGSYNYYAPAVALAGWAGYLYVLFMKKVHYISFLPYVPAVIGIIYGFTLTLIRWGILDPNVLKFW